MAGYYVLILEIHAFGSCSLVNVIKSTCIQRVAEIRLNLDISAIFRQFTKFILPTIYFLEEEFYFISVREWVCAKYV